MAEVIGGATEDEMVAEFLKGEIDSPRFGRHYLTLLLRMGSTRSQLIDAPDMTSESDHQRRRELLAVRGYPSAALFTGYPNDVRWQRICFSAWEVGQLQYARVASWIVLSGGTRLVIDGANNMSDTSIEGLSATFDLSSAGLTQLKETACHVQVVATEYFRGKALASPIAVEVNSRFVLLEGHVRATGYVLSGSTNLFQCLVGRSQAIPGWEPPLLS